MLATPSLPAAGEMAAQESSAVGDVGEAASEATQDPVLRFRNYRPRDEALPHAAIEPAVRPPKPAPAQPEAPVPSAEPLLNLAPKKPNWDLQRDIEKDMAKLERQTELAIMELLRRKIAEGGSAGDQPALDLAAAVREQERAEQLANDDDE